MLGAKRMEPNTKAALTKKLLAIASCRISSARHPRPLTLSTSWMQCSAAASKTLECLLPWFPQANGRRARTAGRPPSTELNKE